METSPNFEFPGKCVERWDELDLFKRLQKFKLPGGSSVEFKTITDRSYNTVVFGYYNKEPACFKFPESGIGHVGPNGEPMEVYATRLASDLGIGAVLLHADWFTDEDAKKDQMLLIIKLYPDGDLFDMLDTYTMDVSTLGEHIRCILSNMLTLKGAGLIHGDIKLENVVCVSPLENTDNLLIDFGLTWAIPQKLTNRGVPCSSEICGGKFLASRGITGTPEMFPPEKERETCDHYLDWEAEQVWQIGLMIREMIRRPTGGSSPVHPFFQSHKMAHTLAHELKLDGEVDQLTCDFEIRRTLFYFCEMELTANFCLMKNPIARPKLEVIMELAEDWTREGANACREKKLFFLFAPWTDPQTGKTHRDHTLDALTMGSPSALELYGDFQLMVVYNFPLTTGIKSFQEYMLSFKV